jgi:hypothetical protein
VSESESELELDSESESEVMVVEVELGSVIVVDGSSLVDALVGPSLVALASLVVASAVSASPLLLLPPSGSTHSPALHSRSWAHSAPSQTHWSVPGVQPLGTHAEISATHCSPASHVPLP